jgi:hypothetical protein
MNGPAGTPNAAADRRRLEELEAQSAEARGGVGASASGR